jgi:hypothetical protein
VPSSYPPLNLQVRTPRLVLAGATDELLERLIPVVRAGVADAGLAPPFDDPMSLYADSPEREWRWLRAIWAGRARVEPGWWRLYFVVIVDGEPAGMQDLIGEEFAAFGTVSTFSWLGPQHRGHGIGREMRGRTAPGVRGAGRARGGQRGVHRQPRIEPRVPGPGLRAERDDLGHAPRRRGTRDALEADPGPLGPGPAHRHRTRRRRRLPARARPVTDPGCGLATARRPVDTSRPRQACDLSFRRHSSCLLVAGLLLR